MSDNNITTKHVILKLYLRSNIIFHTSIFVETEAFNSLMLQIRLMLELPSDVKIRFLNVQCVWSGNSIKIYFCWYEVEGF